MNDRDFMRYSRQILLDDIALGGLPSFVFYGATAKAYGARPSGKLPGR